MSGKLETRELEERILPYAGARRPETVLGPGVGEDSCALDLEGELTVLSTDPITGADRESGYLAVVVSCNDIAANGAEPVAILLTILLPETAGAGDAERIMKEADRAARELGVAIVGGHTEVTPGLGQTILSVTAVGRVPPAGLRRAQDVQAGEDLVLTKGAGIEGTAILCTDYQEQLGPVLGAGALRQGQDLYRRLSVLPEARIARGVPVSAMHDVTEGGVLGAAYEMAAACRLGLRLERDRIPVLPVTRQLCRHLSIDPLRLVSSGSLLVATRTGAALVRALEDAGIPAAVIGQFGGDGICLADGGACGPVLPPKGDELWTARRRMDHGKKTGGGV